MIRALNVEDIECESWWIQIIFMLGLNWVKRSTYILANMILQSMLSKTQRLCFMTIRDKYVGLNFIYKPLYYVLA